MQSKILVGTTDGLHEVDGERRILLGGHEVTSLASGDAGWWAIIDGREIWGTGSDGAWDQVAPALDTRVNCLLATAAGLFVGASEARLFALRGETLEPVRAFDKTEGQESWYTPWRGPPDVRSMSADPAGALYVNVHVGGVPHSADGGVPWKPTIDINSDAFIRSYSTVAQAGSLRLLLADLQSARTPANPGDSKPTNCTGRTFGLSPSPARPSWSAPLPARIQTAQPSTTGRWTGRSRSSGAGMACPSGTPITSTPSAWQRQARSRHSGLMRAPCSSRPMREGTGRWWRRGFHRSGAWPLLDNGSAALVPVS